MKTGQAIKVIRSIKKITQLQLSQKSGYTQAYISLVESGLKEPSPKAIRNIAKVLNVPSSIILMKAMEEKDVHKNKKEIFKSLYPVIDNLINELVKIN